MNFFAITPMVSGSCRQNMSQNQSTVVPYGIIFWVPFQKLGSQIQRLDRIPALLYLNPSEEIATYELDAYSQMNRLYKTSVFGDFL